MWCNWVTLSQILLLFCCAVVSRSVEVVVSNAAFSPKELAFLSRHRSLLLSSLQPCHLRWKQNSYFSVSSSIAEQTLQIDAIFPCGHKTMLDVFQLSQRPVVDVDFLFPSVDSLPVSIPHQTAELLSHSSWHGNASTLIVYTTSNQLPMSVASLHFLRKTSPYADLLIVDDHSTDGSAEYFRKRGFAVISKHRPSGLTESWNIGYRLAAALGYRYVIFTNNDVLFTAESIRVLSLDREEDHAILVPMTTQKGAGHHPPQSLFPSWNLSLAIFSDYVDDYRNALAIQASVNHKIDLLPSKTQYPGQLAVTGNAPHFNGFCFRVDLLKALPAAHVADVYLFDPANRVVGQEDSLARRIHVFNLTAKISHAAFAFHFKSVTVSSVRFEDFERAMLARNISVRRYGKTTNANLTFTDPVTGISRSRWVDIREDLRWYHKEASLLDDFVHALSHAATPHNTTGKGKLHHKDHLKQHDGGLKQKLHHCATGNQTHYFPWQEDRARFLHSTNSKHSPPRANGALNNLYSLWTDLSIDMKTSSFCLYPLLWHGTRCARLLDPRGTVELDFFAQRGITAAHTAAPEPYCNETFAEWRYPVFTVVFVVAGGNSVEHVAVSRFSEALQSEYSNVRVELWSAGKSRDWLYNADLLVVTVPTFDLLEVLDMFQSPSQLDNHHNDGNDGNMFCRRKQQIKSSLLSVAWMLSDLQLWVTSSWLGHYDVFWAPSNNTKLFLDKLDLRLGGFATRCIHSCPRVQPSSSQAASWKGFPAKRAHSLMYTFPLAATKMGVAQPAAISQRLANQVDFLVLDFADSQSTDFSQSISCISLANIKVLKHHSSEKNRLGWKEVNPAGDREFSTEALFAAAQQVRYVVLLAPKDQLDNSVLTSIMLDMVLISNSTVVLSNDHDLMLQYFGTDLLEHGINLPTVSNSTSFCTSVALFDANPSLREKTIVAMKAALQKRHTYKQRAKQFGQQLIADFSIRLAPKQRTTAQPAADKAERQQSLCFAVTTRPDQLVQLKDMLHSVIESYSKTESMERNLSLLRFLVADSAPGNFSTAALLELADTFSAKYRQPVVNVLVSKQVRAVFPPAQKKAFALEVGDHLLQAMFAMQRCKQDVLTMHSNSCSAKEAYLPSCDWIVLSNVSTSRYSSDWWEKVSPLLQQDDVDAVGWNVAQNETNCEKKNDSLASVFLENVAMRSSLYQRLNAKLLSNSVFSDLADRESRLLQYLVGNLDKKKLRWIPDCLAFF